jgi:AcrR family transcriptional regulator
LFGRRPRQYAAGVARVSAGDRREQLIEAAISRAVREGSAATTVRGIADEAGVS